MTMKIVCTHTNKKQAEEAANALELAGCQVDVQKEHSGVWAVYADGKFATRTVLEKF